MNTYIVEHLITPYCYSNNDELVTQWYNWLQEIIDTHIPRVTYHRAQLPPWVTPPTKSKRWTPWKGNMNENRIHLSSWKWKGMKKTSKTGC